MENKNNIFDKEYMDSLNRLYNDNSKLTGFKWFLDTAYSWAYKKNSAPDVVVLGTAIPEELIMAAGTEPYWLIGGSLGSVSWSDDLVPRDTDPVSRSVLGYINRPDGVDFSDSLFIIPLVNDSMRKIAYQLKSEGKKICLADIPPSRNDKYATENYKNQMKELCTAVSAHTGIRVSKHSVVSAMKRVSNARAALARFLELSRGRTDIITDSARLFVQNSYYMTDSIERWTYHVESLSKEVAFYASQSKNKEYKRPSIMIAGSPVIFPNYKIPFLIRDAGLAIYDSADYITLKTLITYKRSMMYGSKDKLIENIALEWYRYDASPAYTQNDVLYEYISDTVKKSGIEGF